MDNPFIALNDKEQTDERYLDRVEFFLSLKEDLTKEAASARTVARDKTKDLLESKQVKGVKLRARLKGKVQQPANIEKNYSQSAAAVAKRRKGAESTEIKKPTAIAKAPTDKTPNVASSNKDRMARLLKAKA